jgi:hypothetical protein
MNPSPVPATKGSTPPPPTTKPPPPPTTTTATASTISKTTTDIKSTATARKTSMSDLEKELEEFDIGPDNDDVSDAENGQPKGAYKKSAIEDEVKTKKFRNLS